MRKALFIDFEDSFSFNLLQELQLVGLSCDVLNWKDFDQLPPHELLILGPGPGHPDDYQKIYPLLHSSLKAQKKIFGICLGHQIFWRLHGGEVVRSHKPLHGQKMSLNLSPEWQQWLQMPREVSVQRYHSLAVKLPPSPPGNLENFIIESEVIMTKGPQVITYQFHPESVGTICRTGFFSPVLRHLL